MTATHSDATPDPLEPCTCGHVARIHGPRAGLEDAGDGCRACRCGAFEAVTR